MLRVSAYTHVGCHQYTQLYICRLRQLALSVQTQNTPPIDTDYKRTQVLRVGSCVNELRTKEIKGVLPTASRSNV